MEKSIRELAFEFNISKEAIYRKINQSMKNELADHIVKKDGKTYISAIGQSKIYQSLKREKDEIQADQETEELKVNNRVINTPNATNTDYIKQNHQIHLTDDSNVNNNVINTEIFTTIEYIKDLKKQLDLLQTKYDNEINNSRRERETLYQLNQSLIDTFNKEQHLKIADKTIQLQNNQSKQKEYINNPIESQTEQPKGFFKKLFQKK